ncbi:MAG TPA: hypothetical protein VJN95_13980 [Gemmatimonadales bacterium]|nr:hypothetical protein [Gemmatimonadales bacterium]
MESPAESVSLVTTPTSSESLWTLGAVGESHEPTTAMAAAKYTLRSAARREFGDPVDLKSLLMRVRSWVQVTRL